MIVLVGGEKGGTGKTTLATNLAALRAADGRDVLLIDTDTQGSASAWAAIRTQEAVRPVLTCISKFGKGVADEVRKLSSKFDDIVIDSGGRDTVELRQAMLVANIMLVPARPSQIDIQTLFAVDRVVGEARGFNEHLKAWIVVNGASTHATNSDADQMIELAGELENLQVASTIVRERIIFRRAYRDGRAVAEFQPGDEKATFEMAKLYKEVFVRSEVSA